MQKKFIWLNEWFIAALLSGFLLLLCLFTGFNGLYGQDAFEYERYSHALRDFLISSTPPGDFFWPVNYPLAGSLFAFVFQSEAFSLQLISILSQCISFVLVVKLLDMISEGPKLTKVIFALCFVGLSPILLRHSVLVMADSFSMACLLGAFYFAWRFHENGKSQHAGLSALLMGCAVMTRYAAAVPVLVPALILARAWFRKPSVSPALMVLIGGGIMLLPHLLLNSEQPTEFTGHAWLTGWSPLNFFKDKFQNPDGFQDFDWPNILFVLSAIVHPGYFFPGIIILFFLRRVDFGNPVLLSASLCFVLSTLFLAGIPYQNIRFLALTFPFAAIALFPAFVRAFAYVRGIKFQMMVTAGIILIQVALFARASVGILHNQQFQKEVARTISDYPGRTIYSFSFEGAFRYYSLKNPAVSIFENRIKECEQGALLLLQPSVAENQWKGRNPDLNWKFFKENCELKILNEWEGGWVLYEIK